MATPAQILANRANALKSTGPKTSEGKDASRRNALKHGLAAATLVLPEEEGDAVAERMLAWGPALDPRDDYECWLVEEVALSSVRIDRCRAVERAQRGRQARRASERWDADRREEAEKLGATLHKSPPLVACRLRATVQGCDWMIARWKGLGAALVAGGDWDEAQQALAMDLLGTPEEFRAPSIILDGDRADLVRAQVASLETYEGGVLVRFDELDRVAAAAGLGGSQDRAIVLAKRYEAASMRRMHWARKQLLDEQNRPEPARTFAPSMPPAPRPQTSPAPPPPTPAPVLAPAPVPVPPIAVTLPPTPAPPAPRSENENRRARRARLANFRKRG